MAPWRASLALVEAVLSTDSAVGDQHLVLGVVQAVELVGRRRRPGVGIDGLGRAGRRDGFGSPSLSRMLLSSRPFSMAVRLSSS